MPNTIPIFPPKYQNPNDIPLNTEEIDDGGIVLDTDHQSDEQMESDNRDLFNSLMFNSFLIVVIIIVGVVILSFFYRGSPFSGTKKSDANLSSKDQQGTVHGSWESSIDSNHNHRIREQASPLRLFADLHNWFNRKKRLFHARRGRRSTRLPNQPTSRAMFYYNNGRAAAALAASGTNGNNSSVTHWSVGSNQSRSSTSPTEPDAMAALISPHPSNRMPPISLVSNPNYFSEAEQHLLENSCKSPCNHLAHC